MLRLGRGNLTGLVVVGLLAAAGALWWHLSGRELGPPRPAPAAAPPLESRAVTEARALLKQAAESRDPAMLNRARARLEERLSSRPEDSAARYQLARCLLLLGRHAEAERAAFKAVKWAQALNNVFMVQRAKNLLGQVYVEQGKRARARHLFKHAIMRQNRFRYHRSDGTFWGCAYQGLGELYSRLAHQGGAAESIQVDDTDPDSLLRAAVAHFDGGDTGSALGHVEQALALGGGAQARVLKGFLLLFQKQYPDAEALFRRVRKEAPADPGPGVGLGHLAIIRKDYPAAARLLDTVATRKAPASSNKATAAYGRWIQKMAGMGMGWALANQNRHGQAVAYFDRVLAANPDDLMGLLGKGNSLIGLGQLDGAEAVLKAVLKKYPGDQYALAELAVIRLSRGDEAAAESGFREAMARDPRRYTCPYEGLGLIYLRQGKLERAKRSFQEAIRINPDIEYKKYNGLARIYMREGRYKEARALLAKSIKNFPHDPKAGELLLRLERLAAGKPAAASGSATPEDAAPAREERAGGPGLTTVSLGLWVPVDLLLPGSRAAEFSYSDHEIEQQGRVIHLDGRPVGLDLAGASAAEAVGLIKANPVAASSVHLGPALLCDAKVTDALNNQAGNGLALSMPRVWAPGMSKECLARLRTGQLFVRVEVADDASMAALARAPRLLGLKLGGRLLTDTGAAHLTGLTELRSLSMADLPITDAGVAHLAGLTRLEQLNLWGTAITDAGLEHLAGLTRLQSLELGDTSVSDTGLAHLTGLGRLRSLGLGATDVVGPGLAHLTRLSRLRDLSLWYTNLTDAGLSHIGKMKGLHSLQIWYTHVTDVGLARLAGLTRLHGLGLGGCRVGDDGLRHLAGLSSLAQLDVWGTRITDAGLLHVARLTSLSSLNLGGTGITDAGLVHLQGMTRLTTLGLWGTRVSDAGLAHLGKLSRLEELELFATRVAGPGLRHLAGLKGLRFLELTETRINDAGLAWIEELTGLRELEVGGTGITDRGLAHIATLVGLKELGLGGTRVTDAGLVHLKAVTGLKELVLGSTAVTDAGVRSLAALVNLTLLELGNSRITDAGLASLVPLKRLMYLGLGGTRISGVGLPHLAQLQALKELELWFTRVDDAALAGLQKNTRLAELELAGTAVTKDGLQHLEKLAGLRVLELGLTGVDMAARRRLRSALPSLQISELASF